MVVYVVLGRELLQISSLNTEDDEEPGRVRCVPKPTTQVWKETGDPDGGGN